MGRLTSAPSLLSSPPSTLRQPPKIADDFYKSREWLQLVARLKRERGRWCERCGSTHRVLGDHIKELRDGGAPLDPANVMLLCQSCHQRKTADARARRARGEA